MLQRLQNKVHTIHSKYYEPITSDQPSDDPAQADHHEEKGDRIQGLQNSSQGNFPSYGL